MSRARRLLYGLLVTVLVLGSAELALRGAGLFDRELLLSPLLFQQLDDSRETLATEDGWVRWFRGTWYQAEPPGFRIIALGGSATEGDGVTPFAAFSNQLQRRLVRAGPDRPVEVINMGRGGLGSRQVAKQLALGLDAFHPQLAVIYSGNNEFHELRALSYASPAYSANMERTRRRLHGLHLYRALQHLLGRDRIEPFEPLGPGLPPMHELPAFMGPEDRALARQLYREHLQRMVGMARAAGVPLVLGTVADNRATWSDDPPGRSLSAAEERAVSAVEALDELEQADEAAAIAEAAWPTLEDERAFFRIGQRLLRLGRAELARRFLDHAELIMLRPNRSNNELREVVRAVAREEGVVLCDIAAALDERSELGVAGGDLFVDACHPSPEGHGHIAALLATCAQRHDLLPPLADPAGFDVPLEARPFRLDHDARRRTGGEDPALDPEQPALSAALQGHIAFSDKDYRAACGHYERALELGAPEADTLASLALCRWHQGERREVGELLERAQRASPEDREIGNWRALLTR
jgi:tetratricopeptide (TPR) repeat protein